VFTAEARKGTNKSIEAVTCGAISRTDGRNTKAVTSVVPKNEAERKPIIIY